MRENYYEILHVRKNAPLSVIWAAYNALYHDYNNTESYSVGKLNEAIDALGTAESRAEYDYGITRPRKVEKKPDDLFEDLKPVRQYVGDTSFVYAVSKDWMLIRFETKDRDTFRILYIQIKETYNFAWDMRGKYWCGPLKLGEEFLQKQGVLINEFTRVWSNDGGGTQGISESV